MVAAAVAAAVASIRLLADESGIRLYQCAMSDSGCRSRR